MFAVAPQLKYHAVSREGVALVHLHVGGELPRQDVIRTLEMLQDLHETAGECPAHTIYEKEI